MYACSPRSFIIVQALTGVKVFPGGSFYRAFLTDWTHAPKIRLCGVRAGAEILRLSGAPAARKSSEPIAAPGMPAGRAPLALSAV